LKSSCVDTEYAPIGGQHLLDNLCSLPVLVDNICYSNHFFLGKNQICLVAVTVGSFFNDGLEEGVFKKLLHRLDEEGGDVPGMA
jgi:hypothetical protein